MKKLAILAALLTAALTLPAQNVTEYDMTVGQTLTTCPAGTHLTGYAVESGDEHIDVSQNGIRLTVKGLKPGDAQLRLQLRGGKSGTMLIHVKARSFVRPAGKDEPQETRPEWNGWYELRMPETNYSIIWHSFRENGKEDMIESYSCIGDVFVRGTTYLNGIDDGELEDHIDRYDFRTELAYVGGLFDDRYKYWYGDGNEIIDANKPSGHDWFESYAPKSLSMALYNTDLAGFGRDNNGDDRLEAGTIMQRIRQTGGNQSPLKRYYRGEETVCGVKCWVFDFRGTNIFGYSGFCAWIDPDTGLELREENEDGSGFIVTRFNLDYHAWDVEVRPELFQ